ncbi:MarR family winged helix-turn-helix transcriptional regulator [Pseudonocardia sp.]|uniref:MarR family winged helix-turn-helix transcriptional regulator n=1 Tax=Pseudonocardia sp. TaxID=60912 RepID=UPI003D0DC38D
MASPTGPDVSETSDAPVRWLSEEETGAWKALVSLLLQLTGPLDAQLQRDSGLSLFEYLVLSSMSMAPGRALRMSELARLANGSLSRLSNVVKRLEAAGWVRRCPDPVDGRYTVAALTDEGFAVVEAAAPGHVDAVRRLVIDPLTAAQQRSLTAISARLLAAMQSSGEGAGTC